MILFENPVKEKFVRKGVTAYRYRNGTININGKKYMFYSMTEAIKLFRKSYPYDNKRSKAS